MAVLIVGVFSFDGLFGTANSNTGVGSPEPYSQAFGPASAQAASATGGPWTIVAAEGIGTPSTVSQSNAEQLVEGDCTFTPAPNSPGTITVSSTSNSATAGEVSSWFFFAINASQDGVLVIESSGGSAAAWGTVTGSGPDCADEFTGLAPVNSTDVLDSTTVAAAFNVGGGSSFLANNSVGLQLFILFGATASTSVPTVPAWDVIYSTCAFASTGGNGTQYTAAYLATTGELFEGPTAESTSC
ncbi:MAG: hypothetical protein WBE40_06425 [Thermoplasmata archaeon]